MQCDEKDKQHCRYCHDSDGCNIIKLKGYDIGYPGIWQQTPIKCYTCHGFECQTGGANFDTNETCADNVLQNCVTVFAKNGTVVQRGCSDRLFENEWGDYCDENRDQCTFCKSNLCNLAETLDQYIDCYYNEGGEQLVDSKFSAQGIRKCYKSCMVALQLDTDINTKATYRVIRGCLDDKEAFEQRNCAANNDKLCLACNKPYCNKEILPDAFLQCFTCTAGNCEKPQVEYCGKPDLYDQCYIRFNLINNQVEEMGCISALPNQTLEYLLQNQDTFLCSESLCNDLNQLIPEQTCLTCTAETNVNCTIKPLSLTTNKKCNQLPYTSCYTLMAHGR